MEKVIDGKTVEVHGAVERYDVIVDDDYIEVKESKVSILNGELVELFEKNKELTEWFEKKEEMTEWLAKNEELTAWFVKNEEEIMEFVKNSIIKMVMEEDVDDVKHAICDRIYYMFEDALFTVDLIADFAYRISKEDVVRHVLERGFNFNGHHTFDDDIIKLILAKEA